MKMAFMSGIVAGFYEGCPYCRVLLLGIVAWFYEGVLVVGFYCCLVLLPGFMKGVLVVGFYEGCPCCRVL
jgi:hypothetical protein